MLHYSKSYLYNFFSAATGLKVPFPSKGYLLSIKPFTPISDQGRISLYNNDTILSKKSGENKEKYQLGVIGWFNTKFSKLTL